MERRSTKRNLDLYRTVRLKKRLGDQGFRLRNGSLKLIPRSCLTGGPQVRRGKCILEQIGANSPDMTWLDGQITNVPRTLSGRFVKPSKKKYSALPNIRVILYCLPSRPTKRGVS